MLVDTLVRTAIDTFRDNFKSADADIVAALIASGIESQSAERAVDFIPLAFFRVMMTGRRIYFADSYARLGSSGASSREYKLADEPIYVEAVRQAREEMSAGTPLELMLRVARDSSELAAIRELFRHGSSSADVVLSPPVFLRAEEHQ